MKFLVLALCIAAASAAVTPMSADQLALFKSSWNTVKHNEVDILYAVFKANPDIQAKFPQFAGKDLDSIKDSADFAVHSGRIVGFFGEYITLLGKESTQPAIKTLLNEMGQNHKGRGIPKTQFNEFKTAVMSYLSTHGDGYNANYFDDVFDKMYFVIFSNLDGHPV
ncbi:hypothetical protein ACKWTF_004668 [Chironomus riparius]